MSEKLYEKDPYLFEFSAAVVSVRPDGKGRFWVKLDRSAFVPEGGGQGADRGTVGGLPVLDVKEEDGAILHLLREPLLSGSEVLCEIDRDRRLRHMRCHTGEHIFSGVIHRMTGAENVGFHLGDTEMTVDFDRPLDEALLSVAEAEVNRIIDEALPVVILHPTEEERKTLVYRSKLALSGDVRLVKIGDVDLCACCAPHVHTTAEVKFFKIARRMNYKGGTRLWLLAGPDILKDLTEKRDTVTRISILLSAKEEECAEATASLLERYHAEQRRTGELKRALMEARLSLLPRDGRSQMLVLPEGSDGAEAEAYAKEGASFSKRMIVLIPCDGGFRYVIVSNTEDLTPLCRAFHEALGGKGGGKGGRVSGKTPAERKSIERFWEEHP